MNGRAARFELPDHQQDALKRISRLSSGLCNAYGAAFGSLLARPVLSRRERELVTLVLLAATGGPERELRSHMDRALECGASADELIAVAEHLSAYIGFAKAVQFIHEAQAAVERGGRDVNIGRIVALRDHKTRVVEYGEGRNAALVLIHGLGVDGLMWHEVATKLADRYRVVCYDMRSHGAAADAPPAADLDMLADDLALLLDQLGIRFAAVAGLSMGGAVAQHFALRYPSRVSSLAIFCSVAAPQPAFLDRAAAAESAGMAALVAPTLARWFSVVALAADGWPVRYARERLVRVDPSAWAASWRALSTVASFGRLHEIRCPTLVVAAEIDQSVPVASMQAISDRIPGACFHVVRGAAHMFPLELPESAAGLLAQMHSGSDKTTDS